MTHKEGVKSIGIIAELPWGWGMGYGWAAGPQGRGGTGLPELARRGRGVMCGDAPVWVGGAGEGEGRFYPHPSLSRQTPGPGGMGDRRADPVWSITRASCWHPPLREAEAGLGELRGPRV